MPTAVKTTFSQGPEYTWLDLKNQGVKWEDPISTFKTWRNLRVVNFSAQVEETSFGFTSEKKGSHIGKTISERQVFFDYGVKKASRIELHDSLLLSPKSEAVADITAFFTEKIHLDSKVMINFMMAIQESLAVFNKLTASDVIKAVKSQIIIESLYSTLLNFIRNFKEGIGIAEKSERQMQKHLIQNLKISENKAANIITNLKEQLAFDERFDRTVDFNKNIKETFRSIEAPLIFQMTKFINYELGFKEKQSIDFTKWFDESDFAVTDDYVRRTIDFSRHFNSRFELKEKAQKKVIIPFEDKLSIVDELLKNGDMTISDLLLMSRALSDSDFEEIMNQSSPKGYGPFKPFLAGDYEYKDALIRIAMGTSNQSRPYIEQLKLEVDLPDIFDAGDHQITDAEIAANGFARIKFSRHFYIKPEVSVAIRGGTTNFVPMVSIVNIEVDHFDVVLRNPQSNLPVTGRITWKAQGY